MQHLWKTARYTGLLQQFLFTFDYQHPTSIMTIRGKLLKLLSVASLALICCAMMVACKKKTTTVDINLGKNYFPLVSGKSITYTLDSTIYDDFLGVVYTNRYYVRDVVDSVFADNQGNESFLIARSIRADTETNFRPMRVYYATKRAQEIHIIDDNQRYIKMVFPVSYTGVWLGNSYIATSGSENSWLSDWRYKYSDFGAPLLVNDTASYPNTITINQRNSAEGDTSIKNTLFGAYTFAKEIYAKDIGLVYRSLIRWKKDPAIGGGKRRGYAVEFKAVDHN
jgi:hypothetical protein